MRNNKSPANSVPHIPKYVARNGVVFQLAKKTNEATIRVIDAHANKYKRKMIHVSR